jgi:hypothetical protein
MQKIKNRILAVAAPVVLITYFLIASFNDGEKFNITKQTLKVNAEEKSSQETAKKILDQIELNPNIVKNSR